MQSSENPPEGRSKILVVEDEWLIALDIQTLIEEVGHDVIGPASSVASATGLIGKTSIDAAFLDISLGSEKSYPIAEMLDAHRVPLTFLSAYGKKEICAKFRRFDLLSKPVSLSLLRCQIAKMLTRV